MRFYVMRSHHCRLVILGLRWNDNANLLIVCTPVVMVDEGSRFDMADYLWLQCPSCAIRHGYNKPYPIM